MVVLHNGERHVAPVEVLTSAPIRDSVEHAYLASMKDKLQYDFANTVQERRQACL